LVKILYVEDEIIFRNLVSGMLATDPNYELDLAINGEDGIKKALHTNYDLIIMDIMMPDIDGVEATKQIKHIKPDSKIISLSALDYREFDQYSLFIEHIRKPIRSLEFKKTLTNIVNRLQL
jgi:CheY-like chemotaxis protein